MNNQPTTRRRFIVAAITTSAVAANLAGTAWLRSAAAWAESPGEFTALPARLARLLFPHDGMADDVYTEVMGGVLATAADDPALSAALQSAETALDEQRGKSWLSLDEAEQIAVLQEVQDEAFFTSIVGAVRGHFYYHPAVWKYLDYPGPSKQFGGYLHRGFDDIDWLPEQS